MERTDRTYEFLNGLDYLRERYPSSLNPSIESFLFCQDANNIWIEATYSENTPLGVLKRKETTNIDHIVDTCQYSIWDDYPSYTPERAIIDNAAQFLDDAATLYRATSILVNDYDIPECEEEEEQPDLSECEELQIILDFVENLFALYGFESDDEELEQLEDYRDYVVASINRFIDGEELPEFSFDLFLDRNDEKMWISVYTDGDAITLSESGHIYTPGIGGDSYTSWMFTIWSSGETDGTLGIDIDKAREMINMGAKISIGVPEEFATTDEEDEE